MVWRMPRSSASSQRLCPLPRLTRPVRVLCLVASECSSNRPYRCLVIRPGAQVSERIVRRETGTPKLVLSLPGQVMTLMMHSWEGNQSRHDKPHPVKGDRQEPQSQNVHPRPSIGRRTSSMVLMSSPVVIPPSLLPRPDSCSSVFLEPLSSSSRMLPPSLSLPPLPLPLPPSLLPSLLSLSFLG